MMAHPLQSRSQTFPLPQPEPAQRPMLRHPYAEPAPVHFLAIEDAMNDEALFAAGPCITCHYAIGDGERFTCRRWEQKRLTLGAGCAEYEREPGAEG